MRGSVPIAGLCLAILGMFVLEARAQDSTRIEQALQTLQAVGPKAEGTEAATKAWYDLAKVDAQAIPRVLAAIDDANPLAANWIRSAAETIAQRELEQGGSLPEAALEDFLLDTQHSPRARRLAYELLAKVDQTAPDRIIPGMLNDPSVEFRRDAVARIMNQAEAAEDADRKRKLYRTAFDAARDPDQVENLVEKLKALGEEVDLPAHFGFVLRWKIVGPFDNTDEEGFDAVYPPEREIDLDATYTGKDGEKIRWVEHTSTDDYGKVNLNEILGKQPAVVAYCYAEFESDAARDAQFRTTTLNAIKLWLNGELIDQHEVYHSGSQLDQYIATGALKQGTNRILLKVCQNAQPQSWAQDWEFQLRVCDATGTAILAANRQPRPSGETTTSE